MEPTSARNWSSWQTSDLAKTSPSLQDSTSAYCFIMFYLSANDIPNGVTNDVSLFLSYLSLSPLDSSVELCLKSEGITAVLAGHSGPSGPSILMHLATFCFDQFGSQIQIPSSHHPRSLMKVVIDHRMTCTSEVRRHAKTARRQHEDSTKTTQNQA